MKWCFVERCRRCDAVLRVFLEFVLDRLHLQLGQIRRRTIAISRVGIHCVATQTNRAYPVVGLERHERIHIAAAARATTDQFDVQRRIVDVRCNRYILLVDQRRQSTKRQQRRTKRQTTRILCLCINL